MAHKEIIYIQGFAQGKQYFELLKAINAAQVLHSGQTRKSGEPYIDHPMRVCSSLVALQVYDEKILSTAILHDVLEDCEIDHKGLTLQFGISQEIVSFVNVLTKIKGADTGLYYKRIFECPVATMVKIADRCHNVSTMAGVFSKDKLEKYLVETDEFVMPLVKSARRFYPEYSNQIISMKYHIESVCNAIKALSFE